MPGEVIVGFDDKVTEDEVNALINSYGLTWESEFPDTFGFWVEVLSGSPDDYIDDLEANDIVRRAKFMGNLQGEPGVKYISVQFNIPPTQETAARKLIDSFENLKVNSMSVAPKWGVVKVPKRDEQKWIKTFKNEKIVRYAHLNRLFELTSSQTMSTSMPIKEKLKSNYLYILGAIILLIILFLISRKKTKLQTI